MNKFFVATGLSTALLLTGCSHKTAFDFFSSDSYYEKGVSNMQKVSLMEDLETKALLHAVYLNNVDPKTYHGDEYFYIAVHIIDDPDKKGLNNKGYRLRMSKLDESEKEEDLKKAPQSNKYSRFYVQEKTPVYIYSEALEINELDENHKLRRTMPVRNQWNHFYLARYKQDANASELTLSFENDQFGEARLKFQKER